MGERTFQTETNAWNQNLEGETAGEFWEQQAIQLDWKNRGSQSTAAWQRRGGSETQAPVAQRGPGAVGSRPLPPPQGGTESCQFPDGWILSKNLSATAAGTVLPWMAFISWSLMQILLCSDFKYFPILFFDFPQDFSTRTAH